MKRSRSCVSISTRVKTPATRSLLRFFLSNIKKRHRKTFAGDYRMPCDQRRIIEFPRSPRNRQRYGIRCDHSTPDGTAIRDYIHESDLAEAHRRALEYLRKGGPSECLNLGSGPRLFGSGSDRTRTASDREADTDPDGTTSCRRFLLLIADAAKAQSLLGWIPLQSDLPNILTSAWEWHPKATRCNSLQSFH